MKKFLALCILFQVWMVTRCPTGLASESLLGAQALLRGEMPYRDFKMHAPPLITLVFAGLFAIPPLAWCSLLFIAFNLMTAYGLYLIALRYFGFKSQGYFAAALYLVCIPFFGGNEMYLEVPMACFGVWAFYFANTDRKKWAALMVLLATLTKQTGLAYLTCFL